MEMNVRLGQQTLAWQVAEQKTAVERHRLQIVEMHDRIARNNVNIAATQKAIAELRKKAGTAVEGQRRKVEIAALEHTVEKQRLENMEAKERYLTSLKGIESAAKAATDFAANLTDMNAAHGDFTTADFNRICEEITNG